MLKELKAFLPIAEKVRARNPTLTILNYIAIRDGQMILTDLENRLVIPVEDDREYTLPIDVIKQIMKSRPSELKIDIQSENHLEINYDKNTVGCQYLDAEEYPSLPKEEFANIGFWTGEMILKMHKQLKHASTDELKPALQGVWVKQEKGTIQSCTTDGHTLEYIPNLDSDEKGEITRDFEGIIPPKCLQILTKLRIERMHVAIGENYIQFCLPHYMVLYSRLIDENFPDFLSILNQENPHELVVDKKTILRAVEAATPFANKETCLSQLMLRNGSISLSARDYDRGLTFATEIKHSGHTGDEYAVGFNLKLLQKTLESVPVDNILWKYRDNHSANLFVAQNDNSKTNLLMPVRLEEDE